MPKYKTIEGDTKDVIALLHYKDEAYALKIDEANPQYAHVIVFDAGIDLDIPEIEVVAQEEIPPWLR